MSLRRATVRNIGVVALAQLFLRFFAVIKNIVLARYLAPLDFGLFSLANSFVSGAKRLEDFGLEAALIQKKNATPAYLASGFAFRLTAVAGTYLFLFLAAPLAAHYFGMQPLTPVLRLLAAALLIGAAGFLARVELNRKLEFRMLSAVNVASGLAGTATAIALAVSGRGVWSLVWGMLATETVHAAILLFTRPTPLKWKQFDIEKARELLRFGRPLVGAAAVSFLVSSLDNFIVAKMLGGGMLGFYAVAYSWANLPVTSFVNVAGKVLFPTVAAIQENKERVRRGYLEAVKLTALAVAPLTLGLMALAPEFIAAVLGEKWLPAAPAMQILCGVALIRGIGGIGGSFRKGLGRPDIFFKLGLLFLAIMLLSIVPLTRKWGIEGTALSILLASGLTNIAVYFYNRALFGLPPGAITRACAKPFLIAGACALEMLWLKQSLPFFPVVSIGGATYIVFLWAFCRMECAQLLRWISDTK